MKRFDLKFTTVFGMAFWTRPACIVAIEEAQADELGRPVTAVILSSGDPWLVRGSVEDTRLAIEAAYSPG